MKKAFTLIELLVVIAIIAILAAILFPVFAQAKEAAKKTACLSNMKQFGSAMALYLTNSDDVYPRQDDCIAPATNPWAPTITGCTGPGFGQRVNHYKWAYWLYPYIKSADVFKCPSRKLDETQYASSAEFWNAYALNASLTGSTNTYNRADTAVGYYRNSWLGGSATNNAFPAESMMFMEHYFPITWSYVVGSGQEQQTAFPMATREVWEDYMFPKDTSGVRHLDKNTAPHADGMNVAYCDTHVKNIKAQALLGYCPLNSEYQVSSKPPTFPSGATWTISANPVFTKDYPFWALQKGQ